MYIKTSFLNKDVGAGSPLKHVLHGGDANDMEMGETVGTDGVCIGSPSSHSHGSLAISEAPETFSRADTAAGSGIGKLSTPSPITRQNVKGERPRIDHTTVLFLQGVAVPCAFLLPLPDTRLHRVKTSGTVIVYEVLRTSLRVPDGSYGRY